MLDLVLAMTPLKFTSVPGYADYYPEAPGGVAAGRSIEPVPSDGRKVLGAELGHLARPYLPTPVAVTPAEYRWLTLGRHPRALRVAAGSRPGRSGPGCSASGRSAWGRRWRRGCGPGLSAADVPVWLDTALTGLEVTGAVFRARR